MAARWRPASCTDARSARSSRVTVMFPCSGGVGTVDRALQGRAECLLGGSQAAGTVLAAGNLMTDFSLDWHRYLPCIASP